MRRYAFAAIPLVAFLGIAGAVANTLYRESVDGYSPPLFLRRWRDADIQPSISRRLPVFKRLG